MIACRLLNSYRRFEVSSNFIYGQKNQRIVKFILLKDVQFGSEGKGKFRSKNKPRKPRGEGKVQFYTFCNLSAGWSIVANATPRPLYLLQRDLIPIVLEAVGTQCRVEGCGEFCPFGIQSPNIPARRKLLCRLRYPGPLNLALAQSK